jgi:NDP-sugar pyrophosphorylase family protein
VKALILAGGRGKRIEELTEEKNKCMLELSGKHLIEYSLACAATLERIQEIVVVVGYRAESIINRFGIDYLGKRVLYVIQWERRGVVDAMQCAQEALEGHDFMLLLGDEVIVGGRHGRMVDEFLTTGVFGMCGVVTVEALGLISRTYSVMTGQNDRIFRLVEKPTRPLNNIMGTGNCVFKYDLMDYIEQTPINQKRGEKELPDLIQCAIDEGNCVKSFIIGDYYTNLNSLEEFRELERMLGHRA